MKPGIQKKRAAFTLIECLVAIGILVVLVALIFGPALKGIRGNATSVRCISNLRQMGAAFYLYAADNNGQLPMIAGDATAASSDDQDGKGKQWDAQITPYIAVRSAVAKTAQKDTLFFCPNSEPDPSYANKAVVPLSYTYNVNLGKSETSPGVRLAGSANLSTVVVLADLQLSSSTPEHSYVPQTGQGRNNTIVFRGNNAFLSFRHNERINILFLDGSVSPRRRVVEGLSTSPPENVRWTPEGDLTETR